MFTTRLRPWARQRAVDTPQGRRRARSRADAGFSLMEVVISFTLLMLIVLPMSYLLGTVLQQTGDARASVAAGLIAEQQLEQAHSVLSAAMTAGTSSVCTPNGATSPDLPCTIPQGTETVQGFTYHIALYFQWTSISGSADVCTSGQVPQVVLAQVTVSWGPTLRSVSQSSVINLPYIAVNPIDGFLAVQVSNAAASGTQGVLVTATSTSPAYTGAGYTDSHGCAFLTVPAASPGYTVSLSPPSTAGGAVYVDQTNNPAPSLSNEAVSTQGITAVSFRYDKAATIDMTYPSLTGVADGVVCPTPNFCVASGQQQLTSASGNNQTNGAATAQILESTDGSGWATVTVPGLARLLDVSCASNSQCEGVGTQIGGGAMAFGVSISGGTWTITPQALPAGVAVSELSSVACPDTDQCYAVGYGVTANVRAGVMLAFNGSTWSTVPTSGVALIGSVACPSKTTCLITANDLTTPVPLPELFSFATATSTFSLVPLTPAPTTLNVVTCGSRTAGLCVVTGTASGTAAAWMSPDGGTTWTPVGGLPAGASTLGAPVCTSTTSCVVPDNAPASSTGQILDLAATTSGSATVWSATAATLPAGTDAVPSLSCPTATQCTAAAQTGTAPTQGTILTSTNGGTTWTATSLPGPTTSYLSGIDCTPTFCAAAGEGPGGDALFGSGGGAWQSDTVPAPAAGVTGLLGAGWSGTVGNTNFSPFPFDEVTPAGTAPVGPSSSNPSALTPLFPFLSGYSVWPGGCPADTSAPTAVAVSPGGTATATVVLAPVSLTVVDASGQPVPGATLVATEADTAAACPANKTEAYALPTTASDGLSRAGFTFGTYSLAVTDPLDGKTTTVTLGVTASGVTVGSAGYPSADSAVVAVQ